MLDDFNQFLEEQKPHRIKQLKQIKRLKESRQHIKFPKSTDYEYVIEEVEALSPQGLVTISQFAAWKGVHRTSLSTAYSEGQFKEAYQKILGICEAYSERRLYEADRNSSGLIFAMKNSYQWVDKTETELSGSIDVQLTDEDLAILDKATRAEQRNE